MSRKSLTERDLREMPAYSIAEAAGYLRVPAPLKIPTTPAPVSAAANV